MTASFRSTRGYTIVAALCDEVAFWPSEDSASPDYGVLDALRLGMATVPGPVLICASRHLAELTARSIAAPRGGAGVSVTRAIKRLGLARSV
jgi:hypothetical protein